MKIPKQAFNSLLELAEDRPARAGYAVVSPEVRALMDDIERRHAAGLSVVESEYQAVAYAVWSGPLSEYFKPQKVFA